MPPRPPQALNYLDFLELTSLACNSRRRLRVTLAASCKQSLCRSHTVFTEKPGLLAWYISCSTPKGTLGFLANAVLIFTMLMVLFGDRPWGKQTKQHHQRPILFNPVILLSVNISLLGSFCAQIRGGQKCTPRCNAAWHAQFHWFRIGLAVLSQPHSWLLQQEVLSETRLYVKMLMRPFEKPKTTKQERALRGCPCLDLQDLEVLLLDLRKLSELCLARYKVLGMFSRFSGASCTLRLRDRAC